jgi:hypothetical protein
MKILVLCPGKIPETREGISCFSDVLNYYLPKSLVKFADCDIKQIPPSRDIYIDEIKERLTHINFNGYDVVLVLGLRFFSVQPKETLEYIRKRFKGLICQTHDGSRRDIDGVDLTFTFKDDSRLWKGSTRWESHHKYNHYVGWAADAELNKPEQNPETLGILIDHTNYGNNPIDSTQDVIKQVKKLIDSRLWESKFKNISVRRFDSGKTVDVDFNKVDKIERFDRSKAIPLTEISKEHNKAHIFMVTHPESVGLVVLETSLAGALTVCPNKYINQDRLDTVRHYQYDPQTDIDWKRVLDMIDINSSRKVALRSNWDNVSKNIIAGLKIKLGKNE